MFNQILSLSIKLRNSLTDKPKTYIEYGYMPRLRQIHYVHNSLKDLITRDSKLTLMHDEVDKYGIFISSFYLNIVGAYDNLAWLIKHFFNVFESVSEDSIKGRPNRNDVGLSTEIFQNALSDKGHIALKEIIKNYTLHFDNIKDYRDSSAHRLLHYLHSGLIVGNQDLDEYNFNISEWNKKQETDISQLTSDEAEELHQSAMDNLRKSEQLKKFIPSIYRIDFTKKEQIKIYQIGSLETNYNSFMSLSKDIINYLNKIKHL